MQGKRPQITPVAIKAISSRRGTCAHYIKDAGGNIQANFGDKSFGSINSDRNFPPFLMSQCLSLFPSGLNLLPCLLY
jgi:hypothetical protein